MSPQSDESSTGCFWALFGMLSLAISSAFTLAMVYSETIRNLFVYLTLLPFICMVLAAISGNLVQKLVRRQEKLPWWVLLLVADGWYWVFMYTLEIIH